MRVRLQNGLPFVTATLTYRNQQLELTNVLVDTGSASSIFAADKVMSIHTAI